MESGYELQGEGGREGELRNKALYSRRNREKKRDKSRGVFTLK